MERKIGKKLISILLFFVMLCACSAESALSESDAHPGEASVGETVLETVDDPMRKDLLTTLATREEIPPSYLCDILQHTRLSDTEFYRDIVSAVTQYSDSAVQYNLTDIMDRHINIFVFESESYAVLLLRLAFPTAPHYAPQTHEYHVFHLGEYVGAFETIANTNGGDEFALYEYEGRAWLSELDVDSSHAGSMSGKATERWYEVSNSQMREVLRFTAWNQATVPVVIWYDVAYQAKIAQITSDYLVLEWSEDITCRDEPILHGEGKVFYYFNGAGMRFLRKDIKGTNFVFEDDETWNGRSSIDLLLTYIDQINEITEHGSETQQEWLREFLKGIDALDQLVALQAWSENESKE